MGKGAGGPSAKLTNDEYFLMLRVLKMEKQEKVTKEVKDFYKHDEKSSNKCKAFLRKKEKFMIGLRGENGRFPSGEHLLYQLNTVDKGQVVYNNTRIFVPPMYHQLILDDYHLNEGMHQGRTKMYEHIRNSYVGISEDMVQSSIDNCSACKVFSCHLIIRNIKTLPRHSKLF